MKKCLSMNAMMWVDSQIHKTPTVKISDNILKTYYMHIHSLYLKGH